MSGSRSFERHRPHPWHGLPVGPDPPALVHAFIEITPFDLIKYEVDKASGYLKVDRPQRTSALPPSLYGFVPRTYCGPAVSALMPGTRAGDGDPLDICVVSERPIQRAEVLLDARVIGGLPMRDADEADDKIIAVLATDPIWSGVADITELPAPLLDRLRHYFLTYKHLPEDPQPVELGATYGREHAHAVIRAAIDDYRRAFDPDSER